MSDDHSSHKEKMDKDGTIINAVAELDAGSSIEAQVENAKANGAITIMHGDDIILVPQPTSDPNDPLNMPEWQKWTVLVILGVFAILSVLLASGMGAFVQLMFQEYHGDPRTSDLLIYPTLFMGLGNIIAVPAAIAIGRRPVLIVSAALLTFTSMGCALSKSYESHFIARAFMALAAGQSEALCPLIIQEINFLHVRGNRMAIFSGIQTIGFSALMIATGHITGDLGWRWWYGIVAIISFAVLIVVLVLVPESRYQRDETIVPSEDINRNVSLFYTDKRKPVLDEITYGKRTFASTLRVFVGPARWREGLACLWAAARVIAYPNVAWLMLMNSLSLATYIVMTAEYAGALASPPYLFNYDYIGYVICGQLFAALVFMPLQGKGGDWLVKKLAKRNNGQTLPEYRLIPMILPVVVAIISCVIFGRTLADPYNWSWAGIAVPLNAAFFTFMGVILCSYTYSIDAYPEKAGAILLLYCASRGIVSFGVSLSTVEFLQKTGPRGAFNVLAILFGAVSALGIPVYFFGPAIRRLTSRY